MNVAYRTLYRVILLGFGFSLAGILIDLDHYGSLLLTGEMLRVAHLPIMAVILGCIHGAILLAFTLRWLDIED